MSFVIISLVFLLQSESVPHILVDQFGYRPGDTKTAVIKNPKIGLDSTIPNSSFNPSALYKVVNVETNETVFEGVLNVFNDGEVDEASGDQIWWFDFSKVVEPGRYYILDEDNKVTSYSFSVGERVYNEVLKHAMRMFFYQRAGFEKDARFAGEEWADKASHVGPGQDLEARLYNRKDSEATARDVHGGWYDAGDYNKYTPWTASYIASLVQIYQENSDVFGDDYNIPESGNGIPDILDEIRFGLDWLLRMVEPDGSVLCIVGEDGTFPPSATEGPSYYGPPTSRATWLSARAFALSSIVFKNIDAAFAARLQFSAIRAWNWAEANPDVLFHNNNADYNSTGLGAGDQEEDTDYRRLSDRLAAALALYQLTGDADTLAVFEDNYDQLPLIMWSNYVSQYWAADQYMFMEYLNLDGVSEKHKETIRTALVTGFDKDGDYAGKIGQAGYRSFVDGYNWGSNQHIANMGAQLYLLAGNSLVSAEKSARYVNAAADYLHYFHGVNPFGLVYLTNMNRYGASNSITAIYHTWFNYDSKVWGRTTDTTPGPAPGYLAGGANEYYTWDGCCPENCGAGEGWSNNEKCFAETVPVDEPPAKMYKDFNYNWPLNSWALTEPDCGYQIAYVRLLSKFVSAVNGKGKGKGKENGK